MPGEGDVPIEWLDPSDREITWEWDDMHMPGVLSALAGDYAQVIATGMAYGHLRMGTPVEMRIRIWNGYAYYGLATDVPEAEQAAMWERRTVAARAAVQTADAYWHEQAVPQVSAAYDWVAARPVETLPAAALADTWDEDPLLCDPRSVPGPRGPRRPVRIGIPGVGAG